MVTEREILNIFSVFPVASVVKDPNYNVLPDSSGEGGLKLPTLMSDHLYARASA